MRFRKMATVFLATLLILSSTTVASAVELDDLVLPAATGIEWQENDENFSNITGQQGYDMVYDALNDKATEPFLLLLYSNKCSNCAKLFPYIVDVTASNDLHLYLLDYYNEYDDNKASYVAGLGSAYLETTGAVPILFYFDGTDIVAVNLTVPSVDVDSYENWLFAWDVLDDGSIDGDIINVSQMYIANNKAYFKVQQVDSSVNLDTLQMVVGLYNNDKMVSLAIAEGVSTGENTLSIDSKVSYTTAKLFSMDGEGQPILTAIDLTTG